MSLRQSVSKFLLALVATVALFAPTPAAAQARTHITTAGSLPANCRAGDVYYVTGTGFYQCSADDTWLLMPTTVAMNAAIAASNVNSAAQNSFLVAGGQVIWTTGYTFRVSAATYYLNGVLTTSAEQTVTLDAADATHNRIDVIVVDSSGTVADVTGTASTPAGEPAIDPGTQLKLSTVLVTAATTEPAAITTTTVYAENAGHAAEWNCTTSGSGFNNNSTTNPRTGSKDIEGTTVAAAAYSQCEIGAGSFNPSTSNFFIFYIRSKATWNNNRGLTITMRSAGVQVGAAVTFNNGAYGFTSSSTAAYQQIAVPMSHFAIPSGTTITQVRLTDFGGSIGFYIDDVGFQGGVTTSPVTALTQTQADALYRKLSVPLVLTTAADATGSADDTLLVSNGTVFQAKAIADCDDSGGNHLNYDTATNALSCGTSSSGISSSSSDTLTNKTLDAEGTGNVVTIPFTKQFVVGLCQNSVPTLGFSLPASGPAVAACVAGTNTLTAVAQFANSGSLSMQGHFLLEPDWVAGIDIRIKWRTSATSGSVVWQVATICVADAETMDPSFNTASTVTDAAKGTTLQTNDATITGVTATGCAAGEELFFKILRDADHASDDLAATAEILAVVFTMRRTM